MTLNITNCSKCGRLMQKSIRNICPKCHQEIEEQYEKCWKYLREHRQCTLGELSEATGVPTSLITKFIREGRISIADYVNMTYECELCGAHIRTSHLCEACRRKLVHDVNRMKEDAARKKALENEKQGGVGFLKNRR